MNRYLLHFGNSNEGTIGGVMSIYAGDEDEAMEKAMEYLELWYPVGEPIFYESWPTRSIQYLNIWINPDNFPTSKIQFWLEEEDVEP